jgi:uracil-DNA glycosylase
MATYDPGPPPALAAHFAALPSYGTHRSNFWYDWGPIFYRGRLDKSGKLLCIASDPGPTERIAGRTLVGDAGQRVQGFLTKLGLTKSYTLVNAFAYALLPSKAAAATAMLAEPAHLTWRNQLLDSLVGPKLQAIVAFGGEAQAAAALWSSIPSGVPLLQIPHPSSRDAAALATAWKAAITQLRGIVTPDPGGDNTGPNYGTGIKEADYARIPFTDLPFGVPPWFGDDAWGRKASPKHNNSVNRPGSDLKHTLVWVAPTNQP